MSEFTTTTENVIRLNTQNTPYYLAEAINTLRGNIQLSGFKLKVIAVVSSNPNEGKSTVSLQLANSIASLKKKTLYIDCDIRNSKIKTTHKIRRKTLGLSEFLSGNATFDNILYKVENEPYLDIIFAGAVSPNPSELFSNDVFSKLLDYVRDKYDQIILDTAPINSVIDGILVTKLCDGTVLVVESGKTERSDALRAKNKLQYAGAKVLGVVLNKADKEQISKKYGYGYGYGYGNTKNKAATKSKKR